MLQELARQVRESTLQVLDATPDDWLHWAPAGTSNHILWHAGHALWLQDVMCVAPLSGNSQLPAGWAEVFGARSDPSGVSRWPSRDKVRSCLDSQLEQMLTLLNNVTDAILARRPQQPGPSRTVLGWIIHGLHDEARHGGEMYLLWKLCRSRSRQEDSE